MIPTSGPTAALLSEYIRAADELKSIIASTSQEDFIRIADPDTSDEDCRSIQTIMNHVVRAGHGYANYIRNAFKEPFVERKMNYDLDSPAKTIEEMDKMLIYTRETLENKWDITFDEVMKTRIESRWGQVYDFEQMLEHAIVHVLRHRRQIQRFLVK